jgi:hypothetical protein
VKSLVKLKITSVNTSITGIRMARICLCRLRLNILLKIYFFEGLVITLFF